MTCDNNFWHYHNLSVHRSF